MSRINKMALRDIFNQTNLILRENDIIYFCRDIEVIKAFIESCNGTQNKRKDVKEFLIENEEKIDKEKLILLLIKNYTDNLENMKLRKEELKRAINSNDVNRDETIKQIGEYDMQSHIQSKNLKEALKLAKGINTIIPFYFYDEKEKRYKVEVLDSRESIDGKKVNSSKNLRRYEEIDESFREKESEEKYGIEYVLQSILLTDLYEICSDAQLGDCIRTMVLENEVISEGIKTKKELEHIKSTDQVEYTRIVDETEFMNILPDLNRTFKEYIQYIDIDKLLLISAYRFNEGLENQILDASKVLSAKEILIGILVNIKNQNFKISCTLQSKKDNSYEPQDIEYSVKDIIRCINQFTENGYLTMEQIQVYRELITDKCINLFEITEDYIDVIFSDDELEVIAMLSDENLKYVSTKLNWDKDKILQAIDDKEGCSIILLRDLITNETIDSKDIVSLYMNGKIDIEQINETNDIIDLSEAVNSYELIQYYKNSIEKDSSEEEKVRFNKYLELYKEILINNKEDGLEENYNELVNALLDNYNGEEYIKVAEDYYIKGLLTLEVLVEWNEEKIIDRFYKDRIISLTDIEALVKSNKLSFEYISNIYIQLANRENIDYDERLNYIKTGYVLEEEIFKMYNQGLIFERDLRELAESGIVRIEETEKLINNRTKEDLEKNSSIRLVGLNELTKINNDIYLDDEENEDRRRGYEIKPKAPKLIIDPNKRAEYISLFNAYQAETDLEEDSPFYNYEFYVIPDESGDIGLNSVVIAERYYEDKDTEEQFSLNNATYFFRYKDLMVLSNLKKSEMTKERENVVFTAKHILADDNKNGYWAAGVIYGISKSMLSSDLKEHTKTEQRKQVLEKLNEVYSNDEVLKILDMASDIDSGKYTYEIRDPKDKVFRKSIKKSIDIEKNEIDDNESR